MKKLMLMLVALFSLQTMVFADDDKPIEFKNLPEKAQKFITTHFPDAKVSFAKEERNLLDKNYKVIFTNGESVEFYKNGEWKEIECKLTSVPVATIPAAILKKVKEQYPDVKIMKIERDGKNYEVKLSNQLEIKFNSKFEIIELDN